MKIPNAAAPRRAQVGISIPPTFTVPVNAPGPEARAGVPVDVPAFAPGTGVEGAGGFNVLEGGVGVTLVCCGTTVFNAFGTFGF